MNKSPRKIPFFNYPKAFTEREKEYMAVLHDVLSRGAFILQRDLQEFEKNLAEYLKIKHAFGVANGTDALIIALKAAGIAPGDEVILPSHTYIASAASIHFVGAKPVLVECGPDHMMDSKSAEAAITSKTKALMPVQVNGRTCDMDEILRIASKYNLKIIEDAAQGLGSQFKDRFAGTFGVAGTISFYPAKLLGCYGDGGAVVTNDDQIAEQVYLLRDHGRNKDGVVVTWGYNSRLDNMQAAILNFKLKSYGEEVGRRREIAARYDHGLHDLHTMTLPPPPTDKGDHFDVYQNYEVEADRRDELRKHLTAAGIHTIIQWAGTPVHQFKELGFKVNLPATEKMFKRCFLLPMNTTLSNDDVDYICEKIRDFYEK